ncbi:GNAT family N-acetyltransferase [Proteobacteria bacterium 005FR1]|nr:GNAT family N-acetyltransferase [Proteobacteria bacterium 005FR1]
MFWNQAQTRKLDFPGIDELSPEEEVIPTRWQPPTIHTMQLEKVESLVGRFLNIEAARLASHFVPAQRDHLDQIVDMRQKMVTRSPDEDRKYLQWRYRFSEPEDRFGLEENRMWVFCKDGDILGFVGVESAELSVNGTPIKVAKLMDLMVQPKVDRKGLGVWMNLTLQSMGYPLVVLGSNQNSLGIMSKLFHRLPNQPVYKNILDSHRYFSARLGKGVLATTLATVYNLASPLVLQAKSLTSGRGTQVAEITRFSRAHDADLAQMNGSYTRFTRSSDFLNWRLVDNPRDSIRLTGVFDDNKLVGFLALALRTRLHKGSWFREAFLLEWGCRMEKHYQRSLTRALIDTQRELQKQGYESISAYSYHSDSNRILRSAGFHHQRDETKTVSIYVKDPALFRRLLQAENWFLTGADTDYA